MTAPTPTLGVVARWTTRRRPASGQLCDECGEALVDVACDRCGQLAGELVGMLATVVDTPAGPQLVIARRTGHGDWTPIERMPATAKTVRAIARPGAAGPTPVASTPGGLW